MIKSKNNCTIAAKTKSKRPKKTTIAILSANPGYRMRSYGPTSLLQLGEHTLLDIQIEAIKACYKDYEIILGCGFEANKVVKYVRANYKNLNIRIIENERFDETNCCNTLRLCLNNVNTESLLVCNGELLLYPELTKLYSDKCYLLSQKREMNTDNMEIGCIANDSNIVTNISFGLPDLWSEIFYLENHESVERLRNIVSLETFRNKLLFESLNSFSNSKFSFWKVSTEYHITKIDDIKTYHKIKEIYEKPYSKLFLRNLH